MIETLLNMQLICAKKSEERVYEFYIGGHIGSEVNGTYVEGDMRFINKNNLADRINFRINSEGGSVINGIRMISSIFNSKIPVHTYNDGYAMSMAGFTWFAAKKENRHMAVFARCMLHAPRFVDEQGNLTEPETEDDKRLLDITKSQLATITKESTGMTDKEVAEILSKDTFYTSEECLQAGFLPKANIIQFADLPQFTESVQDNIQRIAAFYNQNDNNNQNQSKMKLVAAHLKLNPDAAESAYLEKIQAIEKERNDAMAELKDLQDQNNKNVVAIQDAEKKLKSAEARIKDYESKEAEAQEKAAKDEVQAAIKEGFFKAEKEKELTAIAVKDIETFRVLKDSVKKTVEAPDIVSHLKDGDLEGKSIETLASKYGVEAKDFNFDYLWKHAGAKLEEMKQKDPKVYAYLEAQYEKENN